MPLLAGLLTLPEDLLQLISDNLSSKDWFRAACACKTLHGLPLKSAEVTDRDWWPSRNATGPTYTAGLVSALKWLPQHCASAEQLRVRFACGSADLLLQNAWQPAVGGLHWPKLRAASLLLRTGDLYEEELKLARDWLQCLLSSAPALQALEIGTSFFRVPPLMGLKHVCIILAEITEAIADMGETMESLAANAAALPHLETLGFSAERSCWQDDMFESCLDLAQCPKLRRVRLDMVQPSRMTLPAGCSLVLAEHASYLLIDEDPPAIDPEGPPPRDEWVSWADRIPRLRCTEFHRASHDASMEVLPRFTCLEHLEVQDPFPYANPQDIPLLHFAGCLANLTVLKVTFRRVRHCSTEGRGVSLIIPAAWCLRVLVVAGVDEEGVKDAVKVMFQDLAKAAQCLEGLFLPGQDLTGNVLLMADALRDRGLVLSRAQCPSADAGSYVYLKELTAAPSSFASLFEKYVRQCDCGVCWSCCLGGMGLGGPACM